MDDLRAALTRQAYHMNTCNRWTQYQQQLETIDLDTSCRVVSTEHLPLAGGRVPFEGIEEKCSYRRDGFRFLPALHVGSSRSRPVAIPPSNEEPHENHDLYRTAQNARRLRLHAGYYRGLCCLGSDGREPCARRVVRHQ